jgi:pimeloyl-ACP methyl ester carboxylesterase
MLQFGHPLANRRLSAALAARTLKTALSQGFARRPPAGVIDALLAPYRTEVGKLSLIRNAAALNTNLTTELTNRLPGLSVPTLVLWGEDDRFQPVRYGERLARDIPGATLVRVPRARHFAMFDQPRAVTSALVKFVGASVTQS